MPDRLRESGLKQLLCDTVQFCFAGESCPAPRQTQKLLAKLVHPDHSLCETIVKGKTIVSISEWPSWLNTGYKRHIEIVNEMFYAKSYVEMPCKYCKLCKLEFG